MRALHDFAKPVIQNREAARRVDACDTDERLAEHRSNTACASCHRLIDPVGFALEQFDAVGRWRMLEEGKPVDARSDIFSFGSLLYEMVTGHRAFHGDTAADTLSAILTKEPPDLSATNRDVHPGLDRIVRHCLEKNADERFHSAHDLAFDLESLSDTSTSSRAVTAPKRKRAVPVAVAAAIVLTGIDVAPPLGLESAFQSLEAGRPVIAPARDGGVNLIGLCAPAHELLSAFAIRDRCLAERCRAYFKTLDELPLSCDIDTLDDFYAAVCEDRLHPVYGGLKPAATHSASSSSRAPPIA